MLSLLASTFLILVSGSAIKVLANRLPQILVRRFGFWQQIFRKDPRTREAEIFALSSPQGHTRLYSKRHWQRGYT